MKKIITLLTAACCFAFSAIAATPGAVFTTTDTGIVVNGNIYSVKEDVYLNGGPGAHGKCSSAGLDDGDYYFVVTDPNTSTVLSTDGITRRKFRVSGGAIVAYLGGISGPGNHAVGVGQCAGNITIELAPYANTPNNGGEYKVSVSKDPTFPNSATKTDNWKIRASALCPTKLHVCVSCPEDVTVPCTTVNGTGAFVTFAEPIVLPLGTPFVCNPPSGSFFAPGTTVVTVIAANAKGQTATCTFNVTVGECPTFHLTCPANVITCAAGSGVCTATGLFVIPPGDVNVIVTSDHQPGEAFPLGVTVVTLTASQGATIIEQCSFTVTVNDCSSGVICGHVFYDTNADGAAAGDAIIAGWKLVLTGAANGIGFTDFAGNYCFSGLLPGTYTVTEVAPPGCWVATTATSRTFTVSCNNVSNTFAASFGNVCQCFVPVAGY